MEDGGGLRAEASVVFMDNGATVICAGGGGIPVI